MGYVTEKGDIYISGYILFARNIFIAPLFKSILVNLADESWDLIRQVLVNDPENFDLPNINDLSNDNLRSYLLDLPIEGQTYFQSLMPAGILRSVSNDALKYPALLDTNGVHVSITGSDDVLIIKDGFGPRKKRYLL